MSCQFTHTRAHKLQILCQKLPACFSFQIYSKYFERIIYNTMLPYFLGNNPISESQFGFVPGNSCINQGLAITHEFFSSFDVIYSWVANKQGGGEHFWESNKQEEFGFN